ncbi:MAG: ABC transporter permease [Lautropia sp.]
MNGLVVRRLGQIVPTVVFATFLVFMLLQLVPGDAALVLAGEAVTDERMIEIREQLGLDRPLLVQYGSWLWSALQGDFGRSFRSGHPVLGLTLSHFAVTAQLVVEAVLLAALIGIPMGIFAAVKRHSPAGAITRAVAIIGVSIPSFVLAMLLVAVFALLLRWFPATGFVSWFDDPVRAARYTLLPAFAISLVGASEVARQSASALATVLSSDSVRTHIGKGLPPHVILRHALRNTGVLIVTLLTLLVNRFLGATVVVETVFAIPGAGRLVVEAVNGRDFPVVQGVVLVMVIAVMLVNLFGDLAYRAIDPRIKL